MTFAELDARSCAVAAHLAALGTGPGSVVALMAHRTPETIAGLWGILKSGAAYLPLEPHHPDARLADVLADSGARHCLAQASDMAQTAPTRRGRRGRTTSPTSSTPPAPPAVPRAWRSTTVRWRTTPRGPRAASR